MTDFQDINNLNPTPTALITGADKVPFYNTSDAKAYAMTMDQLQTWVLAGGTIDPTFDDVSADTVTITGTTGNTLVVDTNTLVVDATNNAVLVGKTAASVGVDGAQFLTTGFSGVSAPNSTVFFLNRNGSDGTIIELARESTSRVTFGVTSQSLTIGTGGSERMRLDASGNLGIGTASPITTLHGVSANAYLTLSGSASSYANAAVQLISTAASNQRGMGVFAWNQNSSIEWFSGVPYDNDGSGNDRFVIGRRSSATTASNATSPLGLTSSSSSALLTINGSGNLGLGVTPSAWSVSGAKALEVGAAGTSIFSVSAANVWFTSNFYYSDPSTARYSSSSFASAYQQFSGQHRWYTAPSGTAGNAITFTQAMTLDTNSNLIVGGTAASNSAIKLTLTDGTISAVHGYLTGGTAYQGTMSNHAVGFLTNNITRWQINTSGHLLAAQDNTYDIGAVGATRPRDLYLAGNMVGGGWVRAGAASAGAALTTTIGSTTATTVGAAGGASALPATPLGYIIAHVGTTQVKIPYYNN